MNNILLIGMPGAGKSTVGVVLAKALGLQFVDTDLLIQQKTGEPLQTTINRKGLSEFLKAEEEVCADLKLCGYVVATGGSVVLSDKAMQNLKADSLTVFLHAPLECIKQRVDNITTRGIAMQKDDSLESVFEKRLPLYKKYADITVNADGLNLEKTVEEIIKAL